MVQKDVSRAELKRNGLKRVLVLVLSMLLVCAGIPTRALAEAATMEDDAPATVEHSPEHSQGAPNDATNKTVSTRAVLQSSVVRIHAWVSTTEYGEGLTSTPRLGEYVYVNYQLEDESGRLVSPDCSYSMHFEIYEPSGSLLYTSSETSSNRNRIGVRRGPDDVAGRYRAKVVMSGDRWGSTEVDWDVHDVAPIITIHPSAVTVNAGTTATFTAAADGTHLSYQWYCCTPSGSETEISGAASSTYSVVATAENNGNAYYCKIYNYGNAKYTQPAILTTITASAKTSLANATISNVDGWTYDGTTHFSMLDLD